jgi:hypothetical protein
MREKEGRKGLIYWNDEEETDVTFTEEKQCKQSSDCG